MTNTRGAIGIEVEEKANKYDFQIKNILDISLIPDVHTHVT